MTRNEHLYKDAPKPGHFLTAKPEWAFIVSAVLTLVVCAVADSAGAANARSDAGTVTNNQTYTGFGTVYNDGTQSSADRSDVHTRPLAIDPRKSTDVRPDAAVAPNARVFQQGKVVTTVREEVPVYTVAPAADDVNARADAGVIVTHPVTSTTPVLSPATGGVGVYTHINP